ncbi:MAG: divalent-cation tolerance protein CutA [Rhodospirillales bacterium]
MTDKIIVLSTCDSAELAGKLARILVENRLAACVSILPGVRSIYRWKGEVEDAGEWLLLIKSRRELFDRLRQEIEKEHSYAVPEIIALPIIAGSEAYLQWLAAETAGVEPQP